jgi:hypothetical protein
MEVWMVPIPEVADSHIFGEPHLSEKLDPDPDPHHSQKLDPDPNPPYSDADPNPGLKNAFPLF